MSDDSFSRALAALADVQYALDARSFALEEIIRCCDEVRSRSKNIDKIKAVAQAGLMERSKGAPVHESKKV
jgi:hypothetical protein